MNDIKDTQLMQKFSDGDDTAFTELMERNFQRVVRIIQRFIIHTQDAEDLAQEVFLRIYNARNRYVPTAQFDTWLYHIITNLCLNHIRDSKRRHAQPLSYNDSDMNLPQGGIYDKKEDSPSRILAKQEICEKVKSALLALPPNQRLAVILSKYEGLSYQEISQVMEISLEATKSLLNRAKVNLKELLTKNVKSASDLIIK